MLRIWLLSILLVCSELAFASSLDSLKLYEGTVTHIEEGPMTGVVVYIEGTETGGVTDWDGHFSVEVTEEFKKADTLQIIISYLGFVTQKISLTPDMLKSRMQIQMILSDEDFGGCVTKRRPKWHIRVGSKIKEFFRRKS